jgi:hypothetical protein
MGLLGGGVGVRITVMAINATSNNISKRGRGVCLDMRNKIIDKS